MSQPLADQGDETIGAATLRIVSGSDAATLRTVLRTLLAATRPSAPLRKSTGAVATSTRTPPGTVIMSVNEPVTESGMSLGIWNEIGFEEFPTENSALLTLTTLSPEESDGVVFQPICTEPWRFRLLPVSARLIQLFPLWSVRVPLTEPPWTTTGGPPRVGMAVQSDRAAVTVYVSVPEVVPDNEIAGSSVTVPVTPVQLTA